MGMFDTFLVPHRGTVQEIQNKGFGCSLDSFRLGDALDNAPGVRVVTDWFESDVNHVSNLFEQEHNGWDRGLGVAYVVVDGYWLDCAFYPTKKIADACADALAVRYQDPAWRAFAWQSIHRLQRQFQASNEDVRLRWMNFLSAFESRHAPRRGKGFLSILNFHRNQIPKASLTWKNLLEEAKKEIQHPLAGEARNPYTPWNAEYSRSFDFYHYDGPERDALTGLEKINAQKPDHALAQAALTTALARLDLAFFEAISEKNGDWFLATAPEFQSHFLEIHRKLPETLWGAFLWLKLLKLAKISPPSTHSYQDGFEAPLAHHFLEVMGLDDAWMAEAVAACPDLLSRGTKLHPIHTLPFNYSQTFSTLGALDYERLSKENDGSGRPPLAQALLQALSHENSVLAFERAKWWLEHHADPNQTDSEGNTPLMSLVISAKDGVNYTWLWSSEERHRGRGESKHVVHTLLQAADFSATNKAGKTLLDLWPTNEWAQTLLRLEEKRRLDLAVGVDQLPVSSPSAL